MLWTMMLSLAIAAPCEWGQPQTVTPHRHTITIDGETYKAQEVADQLRACGQVDAADAVELWQNKQKFARSAVLGQAFIGVTFDGELGLWIPWQALREGADFSKGAKKARERAVALILLGAVPAGVTRDVVGAQPPEGEPLDPSTFGLPYED